MHDRRALRADGRLVAMTAAPDLFVRASRGPVCVSDLPDDTEGARYELIDGSL